MFPKTKAKRDLLRPRTVCRKDEEAYPVSSITDLYTVIEFFYFIFMEDLPDISRCCRFMKCESRGGNGGISKKYIDGDIIGRLGVLKNVLLLLIPIF